MSRRAPLAYVAWQRAGGNPGVKWHAYTDRTCTNRLPEEGEPLYGLEDLKAPDERALRRQFEEWITQPPYEMSVVRIPDDAEKFAWPGHYRAYEVQLAWEAWQASANYGNASNATTLT